MPEILHADHIAGPWEPQRTNNFTILLPLPGNAGALVQAACDAANIPEDRNSPIPIAYGNENRKVAGVATFGEVTLTLKDFIDSPIMQTIMNWHRSVYNPLTGQINYALRYKVQAQLRLLDPMGAVSRSYSLFGVWPMNVNPGDGNFSQNADNKITITLKVDKAIENV